MKTNRNGRGKIRVLNKYVTTPDVSLCNKFACQYEFIRSCKLRRIKSRIFSIVILTQFAYFKISHIENNTDGWTIFNSHHNNNEKKDNLTSAQFFEKPATTFAAHHTQYSYNENRTRHVSRMQHVYKIIRKVRISAILHESERVWQFGAISAPNSNGSGGRSARAFRPCAPSWRFRIGADFDCGLSDADGRPVGANVRWKLMFVWRLAARAANVKYSRRPYELVHLFQVSIIGSPD